MSERHSGTAADMYSKYFPGEPYTIIFEPTEQQSTAITGIVTGRAADDAESEMLLQMLGILPSEGAFNPNARDAWTKKPKRSTHPNRDARRKAACPQGHPRATHSTPDRMGRMYCLTCKRADADRRREKAQLRRAAA